MAVDLGKYQGTSKWLKAKDLTDQDLDACLVTIEDVYEETFPAREGKPAEEKLAVKFAEFEKPMAMNVTNTRIIVELYGEDTDDWTNKKLKLRIGRANNPNTGQQVDTLQLAAPPPSRAKGTSAPKPVPVKEDSEDPYANE